MDARAPRGAGQPVNPLKSTSAAAETLAATVVLAREVHRDNRPHTSSTDRADDRIGVVPCVCDQRLAGRVIDQVLRFRRVVLLAGREDDVERFIFGRRDRVYFGGKTSSRTAQSIASDPPFSSSRILVRPDHRAVDKRADVVINAQGPHDDDDESPKASLSGWRRSERSR